MRTALIALAAVSFASAIPAIAQTGGYYAATPATAPAKKNLVTRDTIWRCNGATCAAAKSGTRPAILCELVVREVGTLQSFSVAGAAFDEAALTKCNARAR